MINMSAFILKGEVINTSYQQRCTWPDQLNDCNPGQTCMWQHFSKHLLFIWVYHHSNHFMFLGHLVVTNRSMKFLDKSSKVNFYISLATALFFLSTTPTFLICSHRMSYQYVKLEKIIHVLHFCNIPRKKFANNRKKVPFMSSPRLQRSKSTTFFTTQLPSDAPGVKRR